MSIAGLFPGQGSQSLGMLAELAAAFPLVQQTFAEASEVLGRDLWQITQQGPESALNSTENTQPIMLAAGVACWRVWQAEGGCRPVAMAGHSLGEYSALVAAGALSFSAAVRLVALRAQLMQSAVPEGEGAMAALLGLEDEQVIAACSQAAQGDVVEAVNFNSPGQIVIAGNTAAVARAIDIAKTLGAKRAVALPVSVPSHCALMKPAAEQLVAALSAIAFNTPQPPVLQNIDAIDREDPDAIRFALAEQLYRPVRWTDTISALKNHFAVNAVVEFGPGKVLAGLNRRIERQLEVGYVYDLASLDAALKLCGEA